jgi:RNA-directed DNA polymerase
MAEPWLIDFRTPKTLDELADHLGTETTLLRLITDSPSRAEFYQLHRIPKRNPSRKGEFRIVFESPFEQLAIAHKNFLRRFERFIREVEPRYPHVCAHGYIRGRSTRSNATPHCGTPEILHADIKDFFLTITHGRLVALFLSLGLDSNVGDLLAKFATIYDRLALGLNGSPLLANLICLDLDDKLKQLASDHQCVYSRYADDLTFSGQGSLPSRVEVSTILNEEGFSLSDRKFYRTKRGQSHFVTGLSVSDPTCPHAPRRFKKRLRQELYYSERFGLREHIGRAGYLSYASGVNKIDGSLKYLFGVDRTLGAKLLSRWKTILESEKKRPTYVSRPEIAVRKVTLFFDEAEIDSSDGLVLAIGCVAVEDVDAVRKASEELLRYYEADPFFVGRKKVLQKKGLHFTDLTQEVRQHYLRVIATLPIRVFVAYDLLANHPNYETAYIELLHTLIGERFIYYDRADVQLVYEENAAISNEEFKRVALLSYYELKMISSRRPLAAPKVAIGKKREEPCLSVVDFMLGVFGDYAVDPDERQQGSFERVRDQYRLIISKPTGQFFTRKNPFSSWPNGSPTEVP